MPDLIPIPYAAVRPVPADAPAADLAAEVTRLRTLLAGIAELCARVEGGHLPRSWGDRHQQTFDAIIDAVHGATGYEPERKT